jgi:hypothetical protein
MQISHFPDFRPGETVFSVAARYLDRMQFRSYSIVSQHFFSGFMTGGATDLPSNLEHLVQALPLYHRYTADTIIDQHTLFPLYAPFLSYERASILRQRMKDDGKSLHWIAGIVTSKVSRPQWLRYCPLCVAYDRKTYGECYWHCIHQVPGVLVCPIHEVMLEDSNINLRLGNGIAQFRSAECSVGTVTPRIVSEHLRTGLVQLARNALWLLENPISQEQGYIQQQFLELLREHSLVTANGKVRYSQLKKAVLEYFPAHMLENVGCSIMQSKKNWLAQWTKMQHPLHHLLFIQFLCQTTQEFFTKPRHSSSPFGNGPWPCLNKLCPHYKDRIILTSAISQGHQNRPIGTFACRCGFTYSRTGPDRDDEAIFRIGRISRYGEVWDQHLTTYWLDPNKSTLQVSRLMYTSVHVIRRQAARLGLPFEPDIPCRGIRPQIYQDCIGEQRASYRALWEETLKTHPDANITAIANVTPKAYLWLRRHDTEWLKEHYPVKVVSSGNERLMLGKIRSQQNNYSLVDADFAKLVRTTAEEIYTRSDFPIQVTRRLLVAPIGIPALLKKNHVFFNFLPLTEIALSEVIETYTAFLWRKLRWSVQSYLTEQTSPSYRAFLIRARIGESTSIRPINQQFIQIAYCSLSAGTLLSEHMPEVRAEAEKRILSRGGNDESITCGSLEAACIDKQLMLPDAIAPLKLPRVYNLRSILLLTVAAIVYGADSYHTVAKWGYKNEELLRRFGVQEGKFPGISTLKKIYAKVDINSFESTLEAWLRETFPHAQNENSEMKVHTGSIYVPGLRLLQPYQHIASEVVAKLC